MNSLTARFSRINRVVFVLGITFSAITFNNLTVSHTASLPAAAQNFVVTNANNAGSGSLREAITLANTTAGADTISFNIPGAGVKVINLTSPLPEITDQVAIDASTQPGYAGTPLIELNGENAGFDSGLVITAGNSTVRGLAIGRFFSSGIVLRSCNNNTIQGNYIGIDATGTQQRQNNIGILLSISSNNVIGGTTAAARNVISGNIKGIEIFGSGNVIQGNFIGTNAAGTAAIGNRDQGVFINPDATFTNNLIGGTAAGARNLISGNGSGIIIQAPGNTVQGNLIGTNLAGTGKIGNNGTGIQAAAVPNTLIGGLTAAARNIISGNSGGVFISGEGSRVQGNYIGTDITGMLALGNTFDGVVASNGVLIGGPAAGARNLIAGNEQTNVLLNFDGSDHGVTVQGNFIGTDVTGSRAIVSFTISSGIQITNSNNLIGGLVPEARNVISGNAVGIKFRGANVGSPQGTVIQGNFIGLNAAGTGPLPNIEGGIQFIEGSNNFIGGTQPGAANKIAFNDKHGVMVFERSFQNSIRGNSIFSNNGLGIDLEASGVTANDANDLDAGANKLQNFPVLTSVTSAGNSTTIQGTLNSAPNTTFQIDFYSSLALDPSGHGEGIFFNTTSVTTNSSGNATINVTFPQALATGRAVTATATDPLGNTSEFSAGNVAIATGNAQFSVSSMRVIEDLSLATITVLRKGGTAGNLSVNYATANGTAIAGQDYTSTSGVLTFSSGQTSKSFQIPITNDVVSEPNETFTVTLTASTLELLGTPNTLVVTIQDRSTVPTIFHSDVSVVEGNTGSTEALFTFTLSAATGRSVSADFATANDDATGGTSCSNRGTDYETRSGKISFQPGDTTFTVAVKICGDTSGEGDETFRINLSNFSNATAGFFPAIGTITDDDVLDLLFEELGPMPDQVAALDAVFQLRDPFNVVLPDFFQTTGTDRNTRVMFFVRGLQLDPGEASSAVTVNFSDSQNFFFGVPAEDVRAVPGTDFAQVTVRLPDGIAAGTCAVSVTAHSRTTEVGRIRIAP